MTHPAFLDDFSQFGFEPPTADPTGSVLRCQQLLVDLDNNPDDQKSILKDWKLRKTRSD